MKKKSEIKYVLELTPTQAERLCSACEFYARMMMGQWNELVWQTMGYEMCSREAADRAEKHLLEARAEIFPGLSHSFGHSYGVGKFQDADIAWELYEVVRYVKAWTDHPTGGDTVNFSPPMSFSGEPLAVCRAEKGE